MSASDRAISRALSDLNFARADLKAASKMDAVQRKPLIDEAIKRAEAAAAILRAEG